MLIRKCRQAVMNDVQHGLAKYELGIKPGRNFLLKACFGDNEMSQSFTHKTLNGDNGHRHK